MTSRRRCSIAIVSAVVAAGCMPTIVRSGLPSGHTPEIYDQKWHHGMFLGLVDASGAYDIRRICPSGWSEFRVETNVGFEILQVATLGIYTPSRVTIVCAATLADPPDPPGEGPLPVAP